MVKAFRKSGTLFYIPGIENAEILENGEPINDAEGVEYIGFSNGSYQFKVQSGRYSFSILQN